MWLVAGEGLGVDRDGAHEEHAILRLLTRQGASDDRENLATSQTNEHEHEHTHVGTSSLRFRFAAGDCEGGHTVLYVSTCSP